MLSARSKRLRMSCQWLQGPGLCYAMPACKHDHVTPCSQTLTSIARFRKALKDALEHMIFLVGIAAGAPMKIAAVRGKPGYSAVVLAMIGDSTFRIRVADMQHYVESGATGYFFLNKAEFNDPNTVRHAVQLAFYHACCPDLPHQCSVVHNDGSTCMARFMSQPALCYATNPGVYTNPIQSLSPHGVTNPGIF